MAVAAKVVVFTTHYCPYCVRAKALLDKKGAAFEEIDVEDRPELRKWLVEASRQRTVPQIFINGRSVGGFTELAALAHRGELDTLLAVAPSEADPAVPR